MKTRSTKKSEIKRDWYLVDAKDKILGRLSTKIASLLMGKNKPYFASHLDCGDYAVVVNAAKIKVSGKKAKQKKYYRHSGYPGGFRETAFEDQLKKDPRKIIYHAVAGMLPQNKLKAKYLTRLRLFVEESHTYQDKKLING